MNFVDKLTDLKLKIEALMEDSDKIDPSAIRELNYLDGILPQGVGGAGTRSLYNVEMNLVTRGDNNNLYASGDAFGTGGVTSVSNADHGARQAVLMTIHLYSLDPVAGDLSVVFSKSSLPVATDNAPAPPVAVFDFFCKFLHSNWVLASGYYHNKVECKGGFIFDPPDYFVYGQATAMQNFVPKPNQIINAKMTFIDA